MLSNPASARNGNLIAAAGMTIAILGTIFLYRDEEGNRLHNHLWIFGGIAIGAIIGTLAAKKIKMTAMPEMVSMFNGMGGACAALIAPAARLAVIIPFSFLVVFVLLYMALGSVGSASSVLLVAPLPRRCSRSPAA